MGFVHQTNRFAYEFSPPSADQIDNISTKSSIAIDFWSNSGNVRYQSPAFYLLKHAARNHKQRPIILKQSTKELQPYDR